MRKKSIKAPKWFLKAWDEKIKIWKEIAEMLNVGVEWLKQAKLESVVHLKEEIEKNLDEDEKRKLDLLLIYSNLLTRLIWIKFRLENYDNEFGEAERLVYDEEKKRIRIEESLIQFIKRVVKEKFGHEFSEITIVPKSKGRNIN